MPEPNEKDLKNKAFVKRFGNSELTKLFIELQAEKEAAIKEGDTAVKLLQRQLLRLSIEKLTGTGILCGQGGVNGGCGREIQQDSVVFRCVTCGVPFHRICLKTHCKMELDETVEKGRDKVQDAYAKCKLIAENNCGNWDVLTKECHDEDCPAHQIANDIQKAADKAAGRA